VSEKKAPPQDEEAGAPMYMLSFGDMMTNLLCFFILLCAFAEERRVGFISDGVRSFRQALMSHGLPGVLPGDRQPLDLGADRVLFRPAKSISPRLLVDSDGTIKDSNRDALRDVMIGALEKPGAHEIAAPIVFSPGTSELTAAHKAVLDLMALRLSGYPDTRVRVEAFAWKEGVPTNDAWKLSMERAQNVISYLASVGDNNSDRYTPIGYGPAANGDTSERQDRWGRRIALVSVVNL